jgi:predicted nucleotidyltransferase
MTMNFGLTALEMDTINAILERHPEVLEALIFGSRAMGRHRTGSDVDIALKGEKLTLNTVSKIIYELNEETNLPYMFDILNYHAINEPALTDHIDRVGLSIYHRKKTN